MLCLLTPNVKITRQNRVPCPSETLQGVLLIHPAPPKITQSLRKSLCYHRDRRERVILTLGVSGHLTPVISKYIEFNYQILFKNQQDNKKAWKNDTYKADLKHCSLKRILDTVFYKINISIKMGFTNFSQNQKKNSCFSSKVNGQCSISP